MKYDKYAIFGAGGMLGESFIKQLPNNTFFQIKTLQIIVLNIVTYVILII